MRWLGLALASAAMGAAACGSGIQTSPPETVARGDPERGRAAIERYGCASCHAIPGIRQERVSYVAPPLERFRQRAFIAGALPNTVENLTEWLVDPDAIEPGTAMPNVGLSRDEATDIAAYLHSLG